MNEQYHTVNTCQWKRDHLAVFPRIFADNSQLLRTVNVVQMR